MSIAIISFFIIVVVVAVVTVVMTGLKSHESLSVGKKNKAAVIREATKRLAQNPNDSSALLMVGDIYFQDQDWEKAYAAYAPLLDQMNGRIPSEQFEISLRYGISALKTDRFVEAKKGLLLAKNINPSHFEINYNLGYIYYIQKEYEKAVPFLRKALLTQPDNVMALKYLGYTYKSLRKYQEALPVSKKYWMCSPIIRKPSLRWGNVFMKSAEMIKP